MKDQSTNNFVLAVLEELIANGKIGSDSLYAWYTSEKFIIQEAMEKLRYDSGNDSSLDREIRARTSERDVASNDVVEVMKSLDVICDALVAAEDWGDLGTILDGATVDQARKLLKQKEPRYRGYAYLNKRRNNSV